jgi:hypothetical protein
VSNQKNKVTGIFADIPTDAIHRILKSISNISIRQALYDEKKAELMTEKSESSSSDEEERKEKEGKEKEDRKIEKEKEMEEEEVKDSTTMGDTTGEFSKKRSLWERDEEIDEKSRKTLSRKIGSGWGDTTLHPLTDHQKEEQAIAATRKKQYLIKAEYSILSLYSK